jgi:hypothetical protein
VATKERAALKPDAVAARFARVQRAWQAVRSSNDAAAQRIGNGWLETIRKNVSAGALTEATEGMNLFVQDKLGGHEP